MRTPAELAFRLRQELRNLRLWGVPPKLAAVPNPPKLPAAPEAVKETPFGASILALADEILKHRFPVFGEVIETGPEIRWRRDYVHGIESGLPYFRRVPYLDFERVGDHKYVWELNRHQHLVVLAQAFCFTGNQAYLREIQAQLESWWVENPFLRGINWTSALEVAFRTLSWVWIDSLTGNSLPNGFRRRWMTALYQHGCFLEANLSVYFSPNTHLLGEAAALHTVGALYPSLPRAARWRALGGRLLEEQIERQVLPDGAHFEQSTYYHVYALDFFLWHELLARTSQAYKEKLLQMAEYLAAVAGPSARIPLIGDDDGGRLFHPYGARDSFGRATLASCGVHFEKPAWIASRDALQEQAVWWIGPAALDASPSAPVCVTSRLFRNSGTAILGAGDAQIIVKAGGLGAATAGHSHSDVLSFVCRQGAHDLLVDSGTYTYLADPAWRNRFRGSAAHNTVRIDGKDQAVAAGPFRWDSRPQASIRQWSSTAERDLLDAQCQYSGFRHRRQFVFLKPDLLLILDHLEGPSGVHLVEQFWHAEGEDTFERMAISHSAEAMESWRSRVFGTKHKGAGRCVTYRGTLPIRLAACISFASCPQALGWEETSGQPAVTVNFSDGRVITLAVP